MRDSTSWRGNSCPYRLCRSLCPWDVIPPSGITVNWVTLYTIKDTMCVWRDRNFQLAQNQSLQKLGLILSGWRQFLSKTCKGSWDLLQHDRNSYWLWCLHETDVNIETVFPMQWKWGGSAQNNQRGYSKDIPWKKLRLLKCAGRGNCHCSG